MMPSGPRTYAIFHAPSYLPDGAHQAVAVGGDGIDGGLQVADLEGHVAQAELVGHRRG